MSRELRLRWRSPSTRHILATTEFVIRMCCRALIASGQADLSGSTSRGTWFLRAGATTPTPCTRGGKRA